MQVITEFRASGSKFNKRNPIEEVVSGLIYVNAVGKWNYICLLLDIPGQEIICCTA